MLNIFITNSIDIINIIYLWILLTKINTNLLKLISSVVISSISVVIINYFELNFMITYISIILIIKIIYKKDLKSVILEFFLVLLIDMTLQLIFSEFVDNFIYDDTLRAIIVELIILSGVIIVSKIDSLNRKITFEKMNSNIVIYFILTFSIYAIVIKIIWNYDEEIILNNLLISIAILGTLVISQLLAYMHIIKVIKEKETLKISNEYNVIINEIVQEIRQRQHDFVNYKNTIRGIVEVLDEKEMKQAIINYMSDEEIYDNHINDLIYIDNIVIRSTVYMNICKAKKYNINFEYKIENNVLDHILNYSETSNILNNLLNNAFDEVLKDECINKNIQVQVLNRNNTSHLIVKNQIAKFNNIDLNEIFKRGYSTKGVGTRGYGFHNVQQIVNLHKGFIKIKVESGEFIFDIYFNNSSG